MKKTLIILIAFMVTAAGCRSYTATEIPDTEPRDQSYCQRIGDMAIGIEPYMLKDKTAYVFNEDLWDQKVLALDVSMIADGGKTYTVKRAEISATDEDDNAYSPMDANAAADRIGTMRTRSMVVERELPAEVKVSSELTQGFLYFDMKPNNAEARRFTVYFYAVADDGSGSKNFTLAVDPYRMFKNPSERWSAYYGGATPCGLFEKAEMEEPAMEQPAMKEAEEPAGMTEETQQKKDSEFEKQLYK